MSNNFDPDAYLKQKSTVSGGFNPDSYLASKSIPEKKGIIGKAWDSLSIPEKMSREGLGMIASAIPGREPTGNMALDVGLNIPKVSAETMAEAAPGFISRGSLVAGGALKAASAASPLIKALGGAAARGFEGISGLEYKTPGVLAEAAKDATLIFGKGKEEAGKAYELIKDDLQVRPEMLTATSKTELINLGKEALQSGSITPQEGLILRQAVDQAWDTLPKSTANYLRPQFDSIAKTISAEADAGFQRAVKSDALRNIFAVNKLGGTSIAKLFLGGLTKYGSLGIASSPIVQGSVATGAGLAARTLAPLGRTARTAMGSGSFLGGVLSPALKALLQKREKDNAE